jgi:hypothetical protein
MAVSFAAGAGLADTVGATRDGGSLRGLAASRPRLAADSGGKGGGSPTPGAPRVRGF